MRKLLVLLLGLIYFSADAQTVENIFYYYKGEKIFFPVSNSRIVFQLKANETLSARIIELSAILGVLETDISSLPKERQASVKIIAGSTDVKRLLTVLEEKNFVEFAHSCFKSDQGKDMGYGDEFVVKLKKSTSITEFNNLLIKSGCVLVRKYQFDDDIYIVKAEQVNDHDALKAANRFYETGLFEYSEPDLTLFDGFMDPNDPLYNLQWSHKNTGTPAQYNGTIGADMKVEQAWAITMGSGIKVAVIDEGVEIAHPDLAANMLQGYNCLSGTSNPGDGGPLSTARAHGTNCAGIIAAISNNAIGVSGVAPQSQIIPINLAAANGAFGTLLQIAGGFDFARLQGADVISNSWGGGTPSSILDDAINRAVTLGRAGKGCVVLFASGNNNSGLSYPSINENVISVGGISMCNQRKSPTSCDGENWWGASYGTGLDVVAPCVKIASTDITGNGGYNTAGGAAGDYFNTFNGTSSATPNAAGVVALILAANTALTLDQVRNVLEGTADKITPAYTFNMVPLQPNGTWNSEMGHGRVNAQNAVLAAQSGIFCNVRIKANGTTRLCTGQNVNLSVINPVAGTVYQWRKDGLNQAIGNSVVANTTGTYNVIATATNTCVATSAPIKVTVLNNVPPLTVNTGTDKQICIGSTVMIGSNQAATGGSPGLDEQRVFGMDRFSNSFVKFNIDDPVHFDTISTGMSSFSGGDFTPYGYYAISTGSILFKVDTATGNQTVIATIVPPSGSWTGLSWDPSTNTLYALASFGSGSRLCTLHPLTGTILSTVTISSNSALHWLAIRNNGDMYTLSAALTNDFVYKINKTSGALTSLPNPTDMDINFAQGADFDPVTDSLYMTAYLVAQNQVGDFRLVNTTTGRTTLIGTLGHMSEIDATAIAGEKYTYNWSPATGLSHTNVSIPFANPSVTTTYTLTVTDMCGNVQSDQVIVTVNQKPPISITAPKDSICVGETVRLSATKNNAYTYQWYRNTILIGGATDSFYVATTGGVYTVRAVHNLCDSLSIQFTVKTCELRLNSNTPVTLCNTYFYDSGGPVSDYANNENFVKTIFPATPGNQVELNLAAFASQLNFDTLIIYDGQSTAFPVLAKLHGNITVPITYISANGALTLWFKSNGSTTALGWEGTIRCYQPMVYRTKASGNINDLNTWEVKVGSAFVNATRFPTASDDSIIIRAGHTITINVPMILDQVLVLQGASLIVTNQLTVNNGVGEDILFSNSSSGRFQVSPDPATVVVNIQAEQTISSVQVFDKNGKLIYDENPGSNQCQIKIDTWAAGVYQLKIISGGEVILSKFTKK